MLASLPAFIIILAAGPAVRSQSERKVGKLSEVYAWKQITYNIDGVLLTQDRDDPVGFNNRNRTQPGNGNRVGDENRFYIQYNNVIMGAERVENRLFVCVPRRRYGIPSTLNYIDLDTAKERSPALKPYPDIRQAQSVTSVYRTRADSCGRLWTVDTGRLELPGTQIQVQTPAILIYDLRTNTLLRRYTLKPSDVPAEDTPTGLASITVDITNNNCADAYAYIPDLTSYGVIVYSLRENDSWRHTHNYFSFNPLHSVLNSADQRFIWRDGIFSITLLPGAGDCKTAFFHSLIGVDEFAVSTCVLKNRTAMDDPNYFYYYSIVGSRGEEAQSTKHDYHPGTRVVFFAEVNHDAISCWNSVTLMKPSNVAILAREHRALSYPSDVRVTGDEVWVTSNSWPRFAYSQLDTRNDYSFYIYKADVHDLISGTICAGGN